MSVIARLGKGILQGGNDETTVIPIKSWNDASKGRLGAWIRAVFGWLGGYSFNIFDGSDEENPTQYEKALFGVRHDDNFPKDVEAFEYVFHLHYPGERGDMGPRNEVLVINSRWMDVYGKRLFFNDGVTGGGFDQGFAAAVRDLYLALLGREPESQAVIEQWRRDANGDLNVVRQGIIGSTEYKALHP